MLRAISTLALLLLVPAAATAQDAPMDASVPEAGVPEGGIPEGGAPEGGVPDAGPPEVPSPEDLEPPPPPTHRLRVAVIGSPPFLLREGTEPTGMSLDIWREVAERMGVDYELVLLPNAGRALDALVAGRYDIAIGPISITSERLGRVEFSQPYWQSSLGILTHPGSGSMWERVRPFLSRAFFGGLALLLLILTIVGTLLWTFERKDSEQFPQTPLKGIGVGIWLALVTMTTVGYGDKAPVTLPGRIVTGVWMVIAMLTASSLTAGIATALTLSQLDTAQISTAEELRGKDVATVDGTTASAFAHRYGARVHTTQTIDAAFDLLAAEEVDAVVYDRPVLQYYMRTHPDVELSLSAQEYEPQGYGFAIPIDSVLRRQIDIALVGMEEEGRLHAIGERWL